MKNHYIMNVFNFWAQDVKPGIALPIKALLISALIVVILMTRVHQILPSPFSNIAFDLFLFGASYLPIRKAWMNLFNLNHSSSLLNFFGFKNRLINTVFFVSFSYMFGPFIIWLLQDWGLLMNDPQNLGSRATDSFRLVMKNASSQLFVGVAEDTWRLLLLLSSLSVILLFVKSNTQLKSVIIALFACGLSGAIFGSMHFFAWGINPIIHIAVQSLFDLLILFFSRNLFALMIAHTLNDVLIILSSYQDDSWRNAVQVIHICLLLSWGFIYSVCLFIDATPELNKCHQKWVL